MQDELADLIRQSLVSLPAIEILESKHKLIRKDDITIRNEMWKCRGMRKLHIERASLGEKLKIVHCVFYPIPKYRIPIFGCDIIETPTQVTAAIVDISPVTDVDLSAKLAPISSRYTFDDWRMLPLWAEDVFSPFCKFARLKTPEAREDFLGITGEYLKVMTDCIKNAEYDDDNGTLGEWVPVMHRIDDQCHYCNSQRKNKKTKAVLSQWFDEAWADNYINEILFDKPNVRRLQSL